MIDKSVIRDLSGNELINLRYQIDGGIAELVVNVLDLYFGEDGKSIVLQGTIISAEKKPAEKIF